MNRCYKKTKARQIFRFSRKRIALFFCNTCFEIRCFTLLPTNSSLEFSFFFVSQRIFYAVAIPGNITLKLSHSLKIFVSITK